MFASHRTNLYAATLLILLWSIGLSGCARSRAQELPDNQILNVEEPTNRTNHPLGIKADAPTNRQEIANSSSTDAAMQIQVRVEVNASGQGEANAKGWATSGGNAVVRVEATGPGIAVAEVLTSGETQNDSQLSNQQSARRFTTASTQGSPLTFPQSSDPRLYVNADLVNLRQGPGIGYPIVGRVSRGRELQIVATNQARDWWQICCYDGHSAWIVDRFVDPMGALQDVALANYIPAEPTPTATPTPLPTLAPPTPTATPSFAFEIVEKIQFPEPVTPRIFLFVSSDGQGIGGYTLRITKDGTDVPVKTVTFPGQPAFTWPIVNVRQRHHNMKVEFPTLSVAGIWNIQLIDRVGQPVGPPVSFLLEQNDPNQEMYLHYRKR